MLFCVVEEEFEEFEAFEEAPGYNLVLGGCLT